MIRMFITTHLTGMMAAICLAVCCASTSAAPLLELTTVDEVYVGKSLAHDQHVCWIAQTDGQLAEVSLRDVTSYRRVNDQFRGMTAVEIRSQLRREFGHDWEIESTKHYLVCASKGRAKPFSQLFESVYRSLHGYVNVRGFKLPPPDFPLIAVVFPNEKQFAANCRKDGLPFLPGLRGYYHRRTNRVNVFEDDADHLAMTSQRASTAIDTTTSLPSVLRARSRWAEGRSMITNSRAFDANIHGTLRDTIVHEATHQAAYNLGLHTRIGDNPKWITEGLATLLEPDSMRKNRNSQQSRARVNQERFEWFLGFAQQQRQPKSLADFVSSDRMFQTAALNGYAQAWALSFYLAETRPTQYWQYLQIVSERDPLKPYRAEERLADFQSAFGNDIDRLEVAFLRFIDDLQ